MRYALSLCATILAASAHASVVSYALGEERMYSPDGKVFYGNRALLVKRTDDAVASKITEEVLSMDPRRGKELFTVEFHINGSSFVCQDAGKTLINCQGELQGTEGLWTGWKFRADLTNDQGHIEVDETFLENGYSGRKVFFAADGSIVAKMSIDYKKLTPEMYSLLKSQLFP